MELLKRGSKGARVRAIQEALEVLGYYLHGIDGDFGPLTEAAVREFQTDRELEKLDGVVGPVTREELDSALLEVYRHAVREREAAVTDLDPPDDAPIPSGALAVSTTPDASPAAASRDAIVAAVLETARVEWQKVVREPPGRNWERIDHYIRSDEGIGWSWREQYRKNREFAWCGAFAAHCYSKAGLKAQLLKKVMPSTYRLWMWARGTARMMAAAEARPGDIVIVGPADCKAWGSHITLCESIDHQANEIRSIEGNAMGLGPDGVKYEGVVKQVRPIDGSSLPAKKYRLLHVIRPLTEDFN